MDKKKLNNEIILCRPAVRKAKVAVIRKTLKKMKILKTCKNESLKEKKSKKAERLFEKVQMMKRVKHDEVTKFGLRNENLDRFLKESSANVRARALASLAKHDAVAKRIKLIREGIPEWETALPALLDSLGNKKGKKVNKSKKNGEHAQRCTEKINESSCKVPKEEMINEKGEEGIKEKKINKVKNKQDKRKKQENKLNDSEVEKFERDMESNEEDDKDEEMEKLKVEEKVNDPFFLDKKVSLPKLLKENLERRMENKHIRRDGSVSTFHAKPFKPKREKRFSGPGKISETKPTLELENLHPSWAAKKVKLIKNFEGKKIKFSDE